MEQELEQYRQSVIDDIKFMSSAEGTKNKEEFLNHVTSILTDSEVIEDFVPLHYEGIGRHGRKLQIDGYVYDGLDECLSLFIVNVPVISAELRPCRPIPS